MKRTNSSFLICLGFIACSTSDLEGQSTQADSGIAISDSSTDGETSADSSPTTSFDGSEGGSGDMGGETGTSTSGGVSDPTGSIPQESIACGGTVYACGDMQDNDGDGRFDIDDPECTGPCDDDESSFATGISGDNKDCKQDCFFDGNSGQSEGCTYDLRCDPENPGENIGCAYRESQGNCNDSTTQECIDVCSPLTPPGCDCYGCCTVHAPNGDIHIFLNGSPDCSLDNLEACTTCTPRTDECGNTCEPEECERCFGDEELPPECDAVTCDNGATACEAHSDCEAYEFCYLNCCYTTVVG